MLFLHKNNKVLSLGTYAFLDPNCTGELLELDDSTTLSQYGASSVL